MQPTENKRTDSFLIAEFRDFFRTRSHFRTPRLQDSGVRPHVAPDPSLFMRSSISNRQTPGLLEINVSCRKQTVGVVSNRQCFAFFPSHFVRPRTPVPAAAPQHLPADHCPLTPDHCRSLIPPSRSLP